MATRKKNTGTRPKVGRHVVLIADSDDRNVSHIAQLLDLFDCETMDADTAEGALHKAKEFGPALIIVSLDLPDLDDSKFFSRLKKTPATAHIPVIAIVNSGDQDQGDRCAKESVFACMSKPVDAGTLYSLVETAIEKNPRKTLRVRVVLPVKVHGSQYDALYGAYSLAISSGGMFLRTMSPAPVNTPLSLEFDVNGTSVIAEGVVIYNCQSGCGPDSEKGLGLRFVDIADKDRDLISEFVKKEVMKGIDATGTR